MLDGLTNKLDRHEDAFAWAQSQAALLAHWPDAAPRIDIEGLREFLEENAEDRSRAVESHLANLISHVMKAALTCNPQEVPHWLTECTNFHGEIQLGYRRSMARTIQLDRAWRVARKKILSSFKEHGEPVPDLPKDCPFDLETLVDPDLNIEALVAQTRDRWSPPQR